ncbi:Vps53-like protein [Sporodiniella umbellata]|nr:Vps53-like protein [Sporodiniella umbellata]
MVQEITRDVKSLDYAKRHLTHTVTLLKRLQMLVTAVNQLEEMSKNKEYRESAQLLQAVFQLMQHFKQYKNVAQIAQLSIRIHQLHKYLEESILKEFDNGFNSEGVLIGQVWLLHDSCLVASVLGDSVREKITKRYIDLQLKSYRQIFSRITEDVAQLDHLSRRYAFLKRTLKSAEDTQIFPDTWAMSARLSEQFCSYTRTDLEAILKNNVPNVEEFLKYLQLTLEFEAQLTKRFEKHIENKKPLFRYEGLISTSFKPYFYLYINTEDATIASMIDSYVQSDITTVNTEDDGSIAVLPSSTDLFYFYRETLVQCSKFSTEKTLLDLSQVFAKHLNSYYSQIIIGGMARNEKGTPGYFRFVSLCLNTAEYCSITTQQLEEKLKEKIEPEYTDQVDFIQEKERFMQSISTCIDGLVKGLEHSLDPFFLQMVQLHWGSMDSVGDQSDYVNSAMDIIKRYSSIIGRTVTNKRYFRTFCDRLADWFLVKYMALIFQCKPISEIGAEQLLLDTHSIKTLLMEIPLIGFSDGSPQTVPTSYGRIINKNTSKVEAVLKTIMSPIEPYEAYVENYLLLIRDKNASNFVRLLELKGIKKPEQAPLLDMLQRRVPFHDELSENVKLFPPENGSGQPSNISTSIATSLSTMASTAASNVSSPTEGTRGKLNENFRKLVMTGMAFRKDLQEKRDQY